MSCALIAEAPASLHDLQPAEKWPRNWRLLFLLGVSLLMWAGFGWVLYANVF